MRQKIALVYLNRRVEGELPVQRFINSYKALDSGVDHEFITIYKGSTGDEIDTAKPLFKNIEHRRISVDDDMTDIDAYLIAADSFPDVEVFCFLNTFSEVVCENWLSFLYNAVSIADVGIAGATASYESLLNSCRLISKVIWLCDKKLLKYDWRLYRHYRTTIEKHAKHWLAERSFAQFISRFRIVPADHGYIEMHDASFEEFWNTLIDDQGVYSFLNGYPPFPNPHIRSNGFMIRREHLLPFFDSRKRMSKNESYLFESGPEGLTRQIQRQKLRAVVVNSCGEIFDVEKWPQSKTFRLGNQQGLLVHDNQVRNFKKINSAERDVLAYMSWGDSLKYSSRRPFTFGIRFDSK